MMARFLLISVLTLFILLISVDATPASTDIATRSAETGQWNSLAVTVRTGDDDDDDDKGGKRKKKPIVKKIVYTCSKLTQRGRFFKCTRCTLKCGKRFGVKATMIKHMGREDDDDDKDSAKIAVRHAKGGDHDDDDDDGKGHGGKKRVVKRTVYVCNKNKKCLRCRASCRRRFGLKKVIVLGGKKRGDDDDGKGDD